MSQKGYVYILTNPSMPGLVKIGKTVRDVEQRANELYQTGVPEPFVVSHHVYSPDCTELEATVHAAMMKERVSSGREFFRYTSHDAGEVLRDCLRGQVEEWLDEFIPDHVIVHYDEHVDIGAFRRSVYDAIRPSSIDPPDFPALLYQIEGVELAPAIERMEFEIDMRRDSWRMEDADLKVVGEE